jgi:hypothetical protein
MKNPEAPAVKREAEEEWGAERSLMPPGNSTPANTLNRQVDA